MSNSPAQESSEGSKTPWPPLSSSRLLPGSHTDWSETEARGHEGGPQRSCRSAGPVTAADGSGGGRSGGAIGTCPPHMRSSPLPAATTRSRTRNPHYFVLPAALLSRVSYAWVPPAPSIAGACTTLRGAHPMHASLAVRQ